MVGSAKGSKSLLPGKKAFRKHEAGVTKPDKDIVYPDIWAWVGSALLNATGGDGSSSPDGALRVFATSVHEAYPQELESRLKLLTLVGMHCKSKLPNGAPSLFIFPGGYFGFSIDASGNGVWLGVDRKALQQALPSVMQQYPANTVLAFGVDEDTGGCEQYAYIVRKSISGEVTLTKICRAETGLRERTFNVGPLTAAFFVCGEFTGGRSWANGPYCGSDYLTSIAEQLGEYQLVVDLAHHRIPGTVNPGKEAAKVMPHQRQMERFKEIGASILVHHHAGELKWNDEEDDYCWKNRHCSNWVLFRGGVWLSKSAIEQLPVNSADT